MSRESSLAQLFTSIFNHEELRLHLASEPSGVSLANGLPGPTASLNLFALEAAMLLSRLSLVDSEFFQRLLGARPGRQAEIYKVRAEWLSSLGSTHEGHSHPCTSTAVAEVVRAIEEYTMETPYATLAELFGTQHRLADIHVPARLFRGTKMEGVSKPQEATLTSEAHLYIEGAAGYGKSTLLRMLAYDELRRTPRRYVPVLVSAAALVSEGQPFLDVLEAAIASELGSWLRRAPKPGLFDHEPEAGVRWLVLIDAFDELSSFERIGIIRRLQGFVRRGESLIRFILTSRPLIDNERPDPGLFEPWCLGELTPWQIRRLSRAWFGVWGQIERAEQFAAVYLATGTGMGRAPLAITLVLMLHQRQSAANAPDSSLSYIKMITTLIEEQAASLASECLEGSLAAIPGESVDDHLRAQRILEDVALGILPRIRLDTREFEKYVKQELGLPKDAATGPTVRALLRLLVRSGLVQVSDGGLRFLHSVFQECLASRAYMRRHKTSANAGIPELLARRTDDRWRGVLRFALDLAPEKQVSALFETLLTSDSIIDAEFAVRLFADGVGGRALDVEKAVTRLLNPSGYEVGCGRHRYRTVALLGDRPGLLAALQAIMWDQRVDVIDRIEAAEAIGLIGHVSVARLYLLEAIDDPWPAVSMGSKSDSVARLGLLGCKEDLERIAQDESYPAMARVEAAASLGDLGDAESGRSVARQISLDSKFRVFHRMLAADCLGSLDAAAEAAHTLEELLCDPLCDKIDREVGHRTLKKYASLRNGGLRSPGARSLDDLVKLDDRVQELLLRGKLRTPQELAELEGLACDQDVLHQQRVDAVISLAPSPFASSVLRPDIWSTHWDLALRAAYQLPLPRHNRARLFIRGITDTSCRPNVRGAAFHALEELVRESISESDDGSSDAMLRDCLVMAWAFFLEQRDYPVDPSSSISLLLDSSDVSDDILIELTHCSDLDLWVRLAAALRAIRHGRVPEVYAFFRDWLRNSEYQFRARVSVALDLANAGGIDIAATELVIMVGESSRNATRNWQAIRALAKLGRTQELAQIAGDAELDDASRKLASDLLNGRNGDQ